MSKSFKRIWNIITSVLVGIVLVLAVALVGVRLFGLQVYTVLSGSMEPTYHTGSLIYVQKVNYTELEKDDVITFMLDEDTVATHRIVEVVPDEEDPSVLRFKTKGDANEAADGGNGNLALNGEDLNSRLAAIIEGANGSGITTVDGASYSKKLVQDSDGNLAIQIDAWSEGEETPVDAVLVLDQSGSMFFNVDGPDSWMSYETFLNDADTSKGAWPGYYMVVTKNGKPMNEKDAAGEVVTEDYKYCTAMVRWNADPDNNPNTDDGRWERSQQIRADQEHYDLLTFRHSFGANPSGLGWAPLDEGANNFFDENEAKYYKTRYGAAVDGMLAFVGELSTLGDCRVAVVGFASSTSRELGYGANILQKHNALPNDDHEVVIDGIGYRRYWNYGGTGVFDGSTFINNGDSINYANAFKDIKTDGGLESVYATIDAYSAHFSQTATQEGLSIANKLLGYARKDAAKYVILFSDGTPSEVRKEDFTAEEYQELNAGEYPIRFDGAINYARKIKDNGAKIYTVSNAVSEDAEEGNFLRYVSSNYPLANTMTDTGTKTGTEYALFSSSADALVDAFASIAAEIVTSSQLLGESSEIRDTVTPYFDIGGGFNGGNIIVQRIPCISGRDENGYPLFNDIGAVTLYDETQNIADVTLVRNNDVPYDQVLSDGSTATRYGDQIVVSGYDYGANTVYAEAGRGAKLRLLIPIEPNDFFVGGQWSVTNSTDSGIYPNLPPESGDGGEGTTPEPDDEPLGGGFEPPHADVEVKDDVTFDVTVDAKAGSLYLETITYEELLDLVEITVGTSQDQTKNLTLKLGEENYGISEKDEWILDYSYIKVQLYDVETDENGEVVYGADGKPILIELSPDSETIDVRRNHMFYAKVWVWSKYSSTETDPETGAPALQPDGWQNVTPADGEIDLDVYYPTFVFKDVTVYYGEAISTVTNVWGEKMDATKYLKWYTDDEYETILSNPVATADGYTPLPDESIGKDGSVEMGDEPNVYFVVNPIDSMVPWNKKTGAVDSDFGTKYANYMLNHRISMNVQVYFENDIHHYDPNNPESTQAMRHAFFLHVSCDDPEHCDHEECKLAKHTSGSINNLQEYWTEEFYILPKTCDLTVKKTGGQPNTTYVFHIYTNTPVVTDMHKEPGEASDDFVHYMSVSLTTDADGNGSVTLYEMPVGTYQVEEDRDWSWRYQNSAPSVQWGYSEDALTRLNSATVVLNGNAAEDSAVICFENSNPIEKWLNGVSDIVKNIFGIENVPAGTATAYRREEEYV